MLRLVETDNSIKEIGAVKENCRLTLRGGQCILIHAKAALLVSLETACFASLCRQAAISKAANEVETAGCNRHFELELLVVANFCFTKME